MLSRRAMMNWTVAGAGASLWGCTTRRNTSDGEQEMVTRIARTFMEWDALGEHRTGSAGDRATAEWLSERIRAAGARPQWQTFPFDRRDFTDTWLEVGGQRVVGVPCYDASSMEEAVAGALGTTDAAIGLFEFSPYGSSTESQAFESARRANRHAAIIAISSGRAVRPGLAVINADSYDAPYGPPVLQVATRHRSQLFDGACGAEVRVAILERRILVQAVNVQASVPGADQTLAPVVVMTPRSGWWHCTSERGGGIAVWLEAITDLVREPARRPLLFTSNTGHELGHLGLKAFLAEHPGLERNAHAWVHLGANFAAAGGQIRLQASDESLQELGLRRLDDAGVEPTSAPVGQRPYGEGREIFDAGGRFVSLIGLNPLFHHPDDRWPDAVDLEQSRRTVEAMVRLIRDIADDAVALSS